jgi:hypothetical protein
MATRAFLAQHGDGARDRAGEPQQEQQRKLLLSMRAPP